MHRFLQIILILLVGTFIQAQSFLDSEALKFRHVGPERGGRSTTVEGVASQPNVFYAGYTGGGVFKTTDYGETWENISDGYFTSPSIGSIEVYQKNPDIIYVGTGSDGLRSNVIEGDGVYKSSDAGKTWKHIGLKETRIIGAVESHPENPDVVFVAAIGNPFKPNAERGVFRSKNGGESWEKVLFISENTGFSDIEFHPTDPNILYAGAWLAERKPWTIISGGEENGIYKSTDGGDTWKKIENGLPTFAGKIDFAVSAAAPDRVYALVEAQRKEDGLYRSDDAAESFVQVSDNMNLLNRAFYYCNLHADPTNPDKLFSLATRGLTSDDGGKTWKAFNARHGDHHDIWINPNNPDLMIEANDGGVNISHNAGKTWSSQFNQPTAELYQVEVDNQYPYWLYAGQQDNYTTIAVPSLPPYGMQAGHHGYIMNTGGCETGPAVPHPVDSDIVYSNCKGRFSRFNKATGQEQSYDVGAYFMYGHNPKDLPYRFQRVAPIHVSPHDPSVIYHCSQFVHRTTDEGKTWETISHDLTANTPETQVVSGSPITRDITGEEFYSTIYAIQESKLEKGLIWVGANDGPVHLTRDGGKTWTNVTPNVGPGGRVDAVEPSAHTPGKAYVSILRYQLGDAKPYIFKTTDYGKTWENVTNGIPEGMPVRVVREDPEVEGLLFAGTEYGLYISTDDGMSWKSFQKNLPITPITDLKIHRGDLVMSTMGRGFWVFDDLHSVRQSVAAAEGNHLFTPGDTYAYVYSSRVPADANYYHVQYPSSGVNIDYYLEKEMEMPLYLEIHNPDGKVIRSYKTEVGKKDSVSIVEDMNTNRVEYTESKALKNSGGGHRFTWDLRHESRVLARPGTYKVRVFSGDFDQTATFEVLADPRILADGMNDAIFRAQEEFSLKVASLMKEVDDYVKELEDEQKSLSKLTAPTSAQKTKMKQVENALDKFKNQPTHYPQQMFQAQVRYLLNGNNGTYQEINQDSKRRFEQLVKEFEALTEMPALNEKDSKTMR